MRHAAPLILKGDSPTKDWRRINADTLAIGDLRREVLALRETVKRRRNGSVVMELRPFEVYQTFNTLRAEEERDADAWRKFKVRSGYIDMVACNFTDNHDAESGITVLEIEVPAETPAYYVWADLTAKEIKHAVTLPEYSSVIRPLCKINTATHAARRRALLRQYWLGDIFSGGSPAEPARYS